MPAGIQDKVQMVIEIESDATGGLNFVVPRAGKVIGVTVIATATNGGGTVLVSKAGAAITAALAMAAANTVVAAAALTQANVNFVANDTIRVVTNGAADRGTVVVDFLCPTAALVAA